MEGTVFAPALEGMKHVKSEDGLMLTKPFLDVCKLILPVIDKFGAAMALVKSDIGGNIAVAMKLAPDRKKFIDVVAGSGDINSDIEIFCTNFSPFLKENHEFLANVDMDALKAS